MRHQPYHHEHPTLTVALRTRTRTFGILNLAVALRGRSCGWGTCDKPRRTFVGHPRGGGNPSEGHHFIELVIDRGINFTPGSRSRTFRIPLERAEATR